MKKTITVTLTFTEDADPDDVSAISEDFADVFSKIISDEMGLTDIPLENWWIEVEAEN